MLTKTETSTALPAIARRAGGVAEVSALAYPVVLQTFSDTLMQVVDSAIVGHLGATELGAVGFSGIWLWTALCAFVGTASGVQTFVAQAYGANRHRDCGIWPWQAAYVLLPVVVLWVLVVAASFRTLLYWLGPTAELQSNAFHYATGRFPGMPAVILSVILTSFFRGLGRTALPLSATIVANLVNVVLCYGFVHGVFGLPRWGVMGAGAATSFANWTYLSVMLVAFWRPSVAQEYGSGLARPRLEMMRRFLRTSTPIGGQWVLDMASFAVFSTIIARMGDVAMAANQAMIQLLSLSFMQAYGISIAAGALVGRYIGARDLESAGRSHSSAMRLGMMLAAIVAAAYLLVPDPLLSIFTDDPEVIALGRPMLALAAAFQVVDAVGIIIGGSLRGAGDTRWPFLVQATMAWLVRIPLVYTGAILLHGGLMGAWFGELGYIALLNTAFWRRFRAGHWRAMDV